MTISALSAIQPISLNGPAQVGNITGMTPGASGVAPSSSGNAFAEQLDKVTAMQTNADQLAVQAATGDLQSVQDYTIAATEAQLMTQLTVTVRNKAVEAFNDIMRMQV
jgi:flagellar hook-basal body complex protein FliE